MFDEIDLRLKHSEARCAERGARVVALLQGKWTVQILCAMQARPVRLSQLKRQIPSASKKALTASLRSLESRRVVVRKDLSSSILHVEYELSDTMRNPVLELLKLLEDWATKYRVEGHSAAPQEQAKLQ